MTKDVKDFVQDSFYEKGHVFWKIRLIVASIILWLVLLAPIFILINSLSDTPPWPWFYHWDWSDGRGLARYILLWTVIGFVVVLACSIFFLVRNNHFEKKVYPVRLTYNARAMHQRQAALEGMFEARFGTQASREAAKYYEVEPEQNIPKGFVDDLFDEAGCPIR